MAKYEVQKVQAFRTPEGRVVSRARSLTGQPFEPTEAWVVLQDGEIRTGLLETEAEAREHMALCERAAAEGREYLAALQEHDDGP